ncbi:MAG: deoxyribodipyrimidine photo-lyase [Campylobacterales bacterium]|nr:deoxyribodipyrimidine photo-lyase [Campylobacterales bacterium]
MKTILNFRRDLRIDDNELLSHEGLALLIFIFDKNILNNLDIDDSRVGFIFDNVLRLKDELKKINLNLAIFFGYPVEIISYLKDLGFDVLKAGIDFDDYAKNRDIEISKIVKFTPLNNSFLIHPSTIKNKSFEPYKIFTPFYKEFLHSFKLPNRVKIGSIKLIDFDFEHILELSDGLILKKEIALSSIGFIKSNISKKFLQKSAFELLHEFKPKINNYKENRDFLDIEATSKIGIHLRFGTISIFEVVRILDKWFHEGYDVSEFYRQLIWREFFNYILYHYPHSEFNNFLDIDIKWHDNMEFFHRWCEGETGYPIIDACMKELNKTGFMHNRGRMIVSSFFTKNLFLDWRLGERYFAKKLLDYESSSNVLSWQWASSTGTDAQPYFRVFNPYLQAQKFDSSCKYIKKYLPTLKDIDCKTILTENGLSNSLFANYPKAIVDYKSSKEYAINQFKKAKS